MKKSDKAFAAEVQRIDVLMAKWGILLGNLGGNRTRRRELATVLALEHGGIVTDLVFKAFIDEGKLQGIREVRGWLVGILENEAERKAYFPEVIKTSQGSPSSIKGEEKAERGPGDFMEQVGSRAYLQKKANTYGTTLSEETFRARRMWMWSRCWGDRWEFTAIADEQQIPVEQCRKEVSDEMQVQWDRLLNDKELADYAKTQREPMTVDEARLQITRRFELLPVHWNSILSFEKGEKIEHLCKEKGYPSPLKRVTLEDWEVMQAANLAKGRKSKGRHPPEPRGKRRHEMIAELDERIDKG